MSLFRPLWRVILWVGLVLSGPGAGVAASTGFSAPKKEDERIPAVLLEPRYDVPAGGRDPFQPSAHLTGIASAEAAATGSGKSAPAIGDVVATAVKNTPTPDEICRAVTVQAVFGVAAGQSTAILNGQLVKVGDTLRVMVRGQVYEVVIKRIDPAASATTVAFQDHETAISVRTVKKNAP
jgi:hypothetical protein